MNLQCLSSPDPIADAWFHEWPRKWTRNARCVIRQIQTSSRVLRHRRVPVRSKLVAACAVAYIFSPIQLIPTFLPVIGQLDDLFVLWLGTKLLRRLTPSGVLAECEVRNAHSALS